MGIAIATANVVHPHVVNRVITLEGDKVVENHCEYMRVEEVHYLASWVWLAAHDGKLV